MSNESVVIRTARVILTGLQEEDAPRLASYRQHPEVARYQSWESYSEPEARELIASMQKSDPWSLDSWYQFGLRLAEDGCLIGDIGIRRKQNGPSYDAEVGYSLDPTYQKQGYMREALLAILSWAARQLHIRRFTASLDPRNVASARLLIALGFRLEASYRQSQWFKGAWADDDVYVLLEEEIR